MPWRSRLRTIGYSVFLTSLAWIAVGLWLYIDRLKPGAPLPSSARVGRSDPQPGSIRNFHRDSQAVNVPARGSAEADKLIIPVAGVRPEELTDTFTQAREGGMRVHDAIDIIAPRGTPVLAASAGTIEKLFLSLAGGNTIYIRSPDRTRIFYYAHLDSYAPAMRAGIGVRQGQVLGTVGASGNADPAAPHLHFEVMQTAPDRDWHEKASALNPYPLLTRQRETTATR